jgi:hypothetical protein
MQLPGGTRVRVVFIVAMLLSFSIAVRQQGFSVSPDFQVYYAAGLVVSHHAGAHLYDRPVLSLDPVMRFTSPETPFARVAASRGIEPVLTYVYPPLLADLMMPLSLLPDLPAVITWRVFNTALLLACAWLLGWLLDWKSRSRLLLFAAMFFFGPAAESIHWGQIGIVLLFCWTAGIVLYAKGYRRTSALALALATSIKLTPLMVVFPLLLWGEWAWLGWYGGALAAGLGAVLVCNGPAPLAAYFLHVLPAMATGVANFENKSISSAMQLVALARHGADVMTAGSLLWDNASSPPRPAVAGWILLPAKGLCAGSLALVLGLILRLGRGIVMARRAWVLAAVATLSIALSPVSWRHSYCVALPLLVLAWHDAFRRTVSGMELALLGLFSIEVGSFYLESFIGRVNHGMVLGASVAAVPVLSVALVAYELLRMRRESGQPQPG